MTSLLTAPFTHISNNIASHRAAQGMIYADMIEESGKQVKVNKTGDIAPDYNAYTEMYVYHGNDWGGTLNLFGGMKNYGSIDNLIAYSNFIGTVYSMGIEHPLYSEMILKRMTGDSHPDWHKVNWDNLKKIENDATRINRLIDHPNIVAGDSHAICMYRRGWNCNSVPFKTLHGAINQGLETFLYKQNPQKVEFYFGNIDIRHHICRQDNPQRATEELAERYIEQLNRVAKNVDSVGVYELLPIENESRLLPKTGHYKGAPFYGSWELRNECRQIFKQSLLKMCQGKVHLIEWVDNLVNSNNELDFQHMEKPKSVHLSRGSYPHWKGFPETKLLTIEDFFV